MEVGDLELLMLVNNYQQRFNEPTFSTLDDILEALIIEVLDDANYIEDEINNYMMIEDNYKCVKMWREQGLLCLQPNEGKF